MLQELFAPMVKTFQAYITEIRDTFPSLLYRFFSVPNEFWNKTYRQSKLLALPYSPEAYPDEVQASFVQ